MPMRLLTSASIDCLLLRESERAFLLKRLAHRRTWAGSVLIAMLRVMELLRAYGTHGNRVIPQLKGVANYFENEEKDFPRRLSREKAKIVRETIKAIEASTEMPKLNYLNRWESTSV